MKLQLCVLFINWDMKILHNLNCNSKRKFRKSKKEDNENYVDSYVNKITYLMKDSILNNDKNEQKKRSTNDEFFSCVFFAMGLGYAVDVGAYRFFRSGVSCEGVTMFI